MADFTPPASIGSIEQAAERVVGYFVPFTFEVGYHFTEQEHIDIVHMYGDPVVDAFSFTKKKNPLIIPDWIRVKHLEMITTVEHEWTHFRQAASTSFGFALYRLHSIKQAMISHMISKICEIDKEARIYMPVYSWYLSIREKVPSKRSEVESIVYQFMGIWVAVEDIEKSLWDAHVPWDDLKVRWAALQKILCVAPTFYGLPQSPIDPLLSMSEDSELPETYISPRAVIEGYARYREFFAISSVIYEGEDPSPWVNTWLSKTILSPHANPAYTEAHRVLMERLGIPLTDLRAGAILELSMFGRLDPIYASDNANGYYWEDLHPGWRFSRIIDSIPKLDLNPIIDSDSYNEFIQSICDYLGWNNPKELCDKFDIDKVEASFEKCSDKQSIHPLVEASRFYARIFSTAQTYRSVYPGIISVREWYDGKANEMQFVVRPPFFVSKFGVTFPHGGNLDPAVVRRVFFDALHVYCCEEIVREATTDHTRDILGRAVASTGSDLTEASALFDSLFELWFDASPIQLAPLPDS